MMKQEVLSRYFGYHEFRESQEQVIDALLEGRDVLAIMPTGAGKSLCYQVPALMLEGVTIVVSPLISLMKDQVAALRSAKVPAAYLNGLQDPAEYARTIDELQNGEYRLVYVAPERLLNPEFLQVCRGLIIPLVVVDEAHCVSQWGLDFRPSYLRIRDFIAMVGRRPAVGAFTATATPKVRDDICSLLRLDNPLELCTGFDRPNLNLCIESPERKADFLLDYLHAHKGESGIVYCSTRKVAQEMGDLLRGKGHSTVVYHAGLTAEERRRAQEEFCRGEARIMVATNAFGMGIDKPDVRFVVHYNMPKSLEAYYQEAGRAGRDGLAADCILLTSGQDMARSMFLVSHSGENMDYSIEEQEEVRRNNMHRLRLMARYASSISCLRGTILRYFGQENVAKACGNCSNCRGEYQTADITADARKVLSCVYHTGQRFGVSTIAEVLKGSKCKKVERLSLASQGTYGLMSDYSLAKIKSIIEALIAQDYLLVEGVDYPVLALSGQSHKVLRGEGAVMMRCGGGSARAATKAPGVELSTPEDRELFQALRAKRLELARAQGVPAYIVCNDSTLRDMVAKKPCCLDDLMGVCGIGEKKQQKYGTEFLEVLGAGAGVGAGAFP